MNVYTHFYSDPHFYHKNIIQYCERPFSSVTEMNEELIRRYNEDVGPDDHVLFVGDVVFCSLKWGQELMARLPGRKTLVRGNHDGSVGRCLKLGFEAVHDNMELSILGHRVIVNHFPPIVGDPERVKHAHRRPAQPEPGEYVLHGHTHEKARMVGQRIHVGVDAWDFRPVLWDKVEDLIRLKDYRDKLEMM